MNTNDQTIDTFLQELASRAPTPGGGSASALIGAVGAALCGMVARLNDKKNGDHGPLHDTIERADALRRRLTVLADEDVAAFEELMTCWKLADDATDKRARTQTATLRATEAPLSIMATALDVMKLAVEGLEKSKKNCISDAGVAGLAAHACVEGARLNVMINLPGLTDDAKRADYSKRAKAIRGDASELATKIKVRIEQLYVG